MHMFEEEPTRLERKLSKELKKEVHREEKALHNHLKNLEKADRHRREVEHLREQLAKIQIKEIRLQERIQEHEIKARELEGVPPELRGNV
jgi:chromosome segregation ATPase